MIEVRMLRAKAILMARGESLYELAGKAGLNRPNLSMVMNGKRRPGRYTMEAVASQLGWDGEPSELFEEIALRETED